jgi:hypothetical protein
MHVSDDGKNDENPYEFGVFFDGLVKSKKSPVFVIPAKAGIHLFQ